MKRKNILKPPTRQVQYNNNICEIQRMLSKARIEPMNQAVQQADLQGGPKNPVISDKW